MQPEGIENYTCGMWRLMAPCSHTGSKIVRVWDAATAEVAVEHSILPGEDVHLQGPYFTARYVTEDYIPHISSGSFRINIINIMTGEDVTHKLTWAEDRRSYFLTRRCKGPPLH